CARDLGCSGIYCYGTDFW
nr:immunoglobulin heavy chain junction region [Macaca mulatta]MOW32150.1 immunoglobulin heavy chain junction region [Macaca mulatta]MOW32266.1 immunoglobulin heavy chain junction region [Macaca mulatta]MOW32359.1 immunoglobulin heavy chain junction region [Macaca mulatta]MOW32419.1 immunoglobulin heavy chain junction region [Macaca mulatta]